jgi:transposase-like protein
MAMDGCPTCQSERLVKNGSVAGKPLTTKINAVLLYLSGLSMHRIAFLLRVSAQVVLTWIRTFD